MKKEIRGYFILVLALSVFIILWFMFNKHYEPIIEQIETPIEVIKPIQEEKQIEIKKEIKKINNKEVKKEDKKEVIEEKIETKNIVEPAVIEKEEFIALEVEKDDIWFEAVYEAINNNNYEPLNVLIDSGFDINLQDEKGNSAIMVAIIYKNIELIRLLLKNSTINLKLKNNDNKECLDLAIDSLEIKNIIETALGINKVVVNLKGAIEEVKNIKDKFKKLKI